MLETVNLHFHAN